MTSKPSIRNVLCICATYNRSLKSLRSIQSLKQILEKVNFSVKFIVYDSGSIDGTRDILAKNIENIVIIKGTSNVYWAQAMYRASLCSDFALDNFDAVIVFNDDISIYPRKFKLWLEYSTNKENAIVGAFFKGKNGNVSYGGFKRTWFGFSKICQLKQNSPDALNFNLLYIPSNIIMKYGWLPGNFKHGMVDLFFTNYLKKRGVKLFLPDFFVGRCDENDYAKRSLNELKLGKISFLDLMRDPKMLPPSDYFSLCRQFNLFFVLFVFPRPYVKFFGIYLWTFFKKKWNG